MKRKKCPECKSILKEASRRKWNIIKGKVIYYKCLNCHKHYKWNELKK